MNVLLANPEFPPSYWGFKYALEFTGIPAAMPSLPLLTVAAMLPADWNIRIVDLNVKDVSERDFYWADLCLFTAMVVQKNSLLGLIRKAKAAGKFVGLGGPYATSYHEEIEKAVPGMVDCYFFGEVEHTLSVFLDDLEAGCPKRVYEGPRNGNRVNTDITASPIPRFDLIDLGDYSSMVVQWSRGCPYNCDFCDITKLMGRIPRLKTNEQMLSELDRLYELGWRGPVFFVDDNFIGNKEKAIVLLLAVVEWQKERGFPFTFFTEASVNLAKEEELLSLMRESRFEMVFLGIESPNDVALDITAKYQNKKRGMTAREYLLSAVKRIQKEGIQVTGGFIVGLDGDKRFDSHISFIEEAGIPLAMVGLLSAVKGTDLEKRLREEGRMLPDDSISGNNTELALNFETELPREEVIAAYAAIIRRLYDPKLENYFGRCLTMIENLGRTTRTETSYRGLVAVRAGFNMFFRQVLSRQGPAFLRFIWRVYRDHREKLVMAIHLSAMGYHFEKVTRQSLETHEFKELLEGLKERLIELRKFIREKRSIELLRELEILRNRAKAHLGNVSRDARKEVRSSLQAFLDLIDREAKCLMMLPQPEREGE